MEKDITDPVTEIEIADLLMKLKVKEKYIVRRLKFELDVLKLKIKNAVYHLTGNKNE